MAETPPWVTKFMNQFKLMKLDSKDPCICTRFATEILDVSGDDEDHTYEKRTTYIRSNVWKCLAASHTCTCLISTLPCRSENHHCNCAILHRINIYPESVQGIRCNANEHTSSLIR